MWLLLREALMSEIIDFKSKQKTTTVEADIEEMAHANDVLQGSVEEDELNEVIVLGWNVDDHLVFRTNINTRQDMLWLLEKARRALMDASDGY